MDRHRDDFFLATKTDQRDKAGAREQIHRSLDRLRTDRVDLIQLHALFHPDEWETALGPDGALEACIEAREQGLVRWIGVTGHGWTIAAMHRRSLERFDFDSILMPWAWYAAQRPAYAEDFRTTLALARERDVAVQTIKSLARGPWAAGASQNRSTWYQPLEDPSDIREAVHWVLAEPDIFLNSVGDTDLLPLVLQAAANPGTRPCRCSDGGARGPGWPRLDLRDLTGLAGREIAGHLPRLSAGPAWLALIVIGSGWGASQLFAKMVVAGGHHPVGIAFTATALGAVILTVVMVATGRRLPLRRRDVVFYGICGFLGTALPNSVSYLAYQELQVGVISIVLATVPMATMLGALAFGMERPELVRMLGISLGAGAVLMLVVPEASLPEPGQALWVILPVITSLSYAGENIYLAWAQRTDLDPVQVLTGLFWGALVLLTPVTVGMGAWMPMGRFDTAEWALIGMTLAHIGAYGGFVWLIARAGPVFASQVGYVVTITGVVLGILVLGEAHSAWVWGALAVMLAGLALVQPR